MAKKCKEAKLELEKTEIQKKLVDYRLAEAKRQIKQQQKINEQILQKKIIKIAELYIENKRKEERDAEFIKETAILQERQAELEILVIFLFRGVFFSINEIGLYRAAISSNSLKIRTCKNKIIR